MVSDTVWRGLLHRHSMMGKGRRATPARTVQLDHEVKFPAMPAVDTAEIQNMGMLALIETSSIFQV